MKANFLNLKKALANAPIFAFPDFTKEFKLQCDASKYSIGGVCLRLHLLLLKKILKPVMFFGRKLSATEMRYSTTGRERCWQLCTVIRRVTILSMGVISFLGLIISHW
jgi:hypothetical protein